jgi:hypothetical protein
MHVIQSYGEREALLDIAWARSAALHLVFLIKLDFWGREVHLDQFG